MMGTGERRHERSPNGGAVGKGFTSNEVTSC